MGTPAEKTDGVLPFVDGEEREGQMPHYFFNFHGQSSAAPDLVGRDLPDDQAAKTEAESIGKEVASLGVLTGTLINDCWIEIVDEGQRPVALLPLHEITPEGPTRIE